MIARVIVLPEEQHRAVHLVELCPKVVDLVGIVRRLGGVLVEALIHVAAHLKGELGAGVARHIHGEVPVERHTELSRAAAAVLHAELGLAIRLAFARHRGAVVGAECEVGHVVAQLRRQPIVVGAHLHLAGLVPVDFCLPGAR